MVIRRKDTLLIQIVKMWLAVRFAAVGFGVVPVLAICASKVSNWYVSVIVPATFQIQSWYMGTTQPIFRLLRDSRPVGVRDRGVGGLNPLLDVEPSFKHQRVVDWILQILP